MTNVSEWSVTPGSNNSSPPHGWPEGMARSAVNDCAREMMAALAKWYQDSNATLTTAGTGNAYTLATNGAYTSLDDLPVLVFRADRTSTGAVTLNVDGLGAFAVYRNAGNAYDQMTAGDIQETQILVVAYNSDGWFDYIGPSADGFDVGTLMLFQQSSAPAGWTKQVTHDNKALRVVTGAASSGGSTAFTSVFTSRTIASANLPNTNLSHSLSVSTTISNGTAVLRGSIAINDAASGAGADRVFGGSSATLALANGSVSGTVSLGGSGTAMDFAVQYVDLIIASKA